MLSLTLLLLLSIEHIQQHLSLSTIEDDGRRVCLVVGSCSGCCIGGLRVLLHMQQSCLVSTVIYPSPRERGIFIHFILLFFYLTRIKIIIILVSSNRYLSFLRDKRTGNTSTGIDIHPFNNSSFLHLKIPSLLIYLHINTQSF